MTGTKELAAALSGTSIGSIENLSFLSGVDVKIIYGALEGSLTLSKQHLSAIRTIFNDFPQYVATEKEPRVEHITVRRGTVPEGTRVTVMLPQELKVGMLIQYVPLDAKFGSSWAEIESITPAGNRFSLIVGGCEVSVPDQRIVSVAVRVGDTSE